MSRNMKKATAHRIIAGSDGKQTISKNTYNFKNCIIYERTTRFSTKTIMLINKFT